VAATDRLYGCVPMKKTGAKKRMPWEQSRNESIKAYAAAKTYFDLGPDGSLEATAKRMHKSLGQMKRWSVDHRWKSRAIAYNRRRNQIEQEAKEDQIRQTARLWAERAEKLREDDYQMSIKQREKAYELLKYPIAKIITTSVDGKTITTAVPAHWNMGDAVRLGESASKLGGKSVRNAPAGPEVVEQDDEFKLVPYKGKGDEK
jgi:hypothetical protein